MTPALAGCIRDQIEALLPDYVGLTTAVLKEITCDDQILPVSVAENGSRGRTQARTREMISKWVIPTSTTRARVLPVCRLLPLRSRGEANCHYCTVTSAVKTACWEQLHGA